MMEPDSDGRRDQRLSPPCPPPLSPLSGPAGLQTALLTQLTAQHASRLQYQQALLAWARLVSGGGGGLPLLADPAALLAGRSSPSASSGSPPRSDGSPPARPARKQTARPKVFTCPVCGRSFGYKHVLQNHVRTHTGEKPFQCTECHKRFTRDHHLKTHMRLHTGEKPYQCAHCARRFVQVANLRRHLRVHTGERPYACRLCSARFSDSNQLKSHELVHSDQKPLFGCSFCGSRFRRRYQLAVHRCAMMQDALTTVAAGEVRLFDRNSSQEMLRPLKPVDVLGAGTAARLTALVTEPGTEGVDEDLAVADGTLSPQTGLGPTPALVDGGQTEPEDLSVTASQWSCSAPEDRRHSPASLPSPAGDLQRTGEGPPRQGSPSSPTGQRRYGEESGGDAPRRKEDTGGQFVPWWVLRERHGSSSGLEESRGLSVTSQDLPPVAAWPLHLGQREQLQVYVYPEKQPPLVRVRGWDQLAPERTTADRSRAPPTADRGDSGGRWDAAEEGRPTADCRWPWSGPPPADARLCVPDEEWVGRPDGRRAVSPRDGALIGLGSSREGEERQGGGLPVPARYRAAGDGHRSQPADRVTSGRTRRALPPLVPLWIPRQSPAPRPPPEVGRGTVEEGNSGSALLQLLTAPSSPPPAAEHGHSQERASSDTTGHRNTGKERSHNEEQQARPHIEELQERPHTERLQEHHVDSVSSDHSWETRGEKPLWESEDENYCRKDNQEIQA